MHSNFRRTANHICGLKYLFMLLFAVCNALQKVP